MYDTYLWNPVLIGNCFFDPDPEAPGVGEFDVDGSS